MLIPELKFRALCRSQEGAMEAERFQEALDKSQDDPVPVMFEMLDDTKTINIPRQECEFYAQIAKEERTEETELLSHITPGMHPWTKHNRSKMCDRLKEAVLKYKEERKIPGQEVILIWPMFPPDQIPLEVCEKYLRKYA